MRTPQEIVVVSGADDQYAIPLAVTIRSALDSLHEDTKLRLFLIDGGFSSESKSRLLKSWEDTRLTVDWLYPNVNLVRGLPVSDHITVAAYLRLLMPELLPAAIEKIIYLDADMLVRRDLSALWDEPLDNNAILAVQDCAAPFIDSSRMLSNSPDCVRRLAAVVPVANYRDLGLNPQGMYFNSGLMVVNIAMWRQENIANQLFDCLRQNSKHVLWWDQYALNVVLNRKWRCLDRRWNQGAYIFEYPTWQDSPFDQRTFTQIQRDPWITHYCSPEKPWQFFCAHPATRDFRRCLQRTAWKNWRPARPEKFLEKWWDFQKKKFDKRSSAKVRQLGQAIGYRRAA